MSVGDPGWALASLEPLDQLSAVGAGRHGVVVGGARSRALWDGSFAEFGVEALVGQAPGHGLGVKRCFLGLEGRQR
jgi:hypothetical protein